MTPVATLLRQAASQPGEAFLVALATVRGWWYKTLARLIRRRFKAGRSFRLYGRLVFKGPGALVIGDDVSLRGRITPWTYAPGALIRIGDRTTMDGVRLGCADSIEIGADCIVAECRIFDTDFHSTHADRHTNPDAPVRIIPVVVEDNVWIGPEVGLLPGSRIGRNSVVGYGAVCVRRYPENAILFGNPAKVVAPAGGGEPVGPARIAQEVR